MAQYKCPVCGLVVLELPTTTTIKFYHQAGSPHAAEPKVFCGRDGTVLAWGRGTIMIEDGVVLVDGDVDPKVKQDDEQRKAAKKKREKSPATADVVVGGVSSAVPGGAPPVSDLPSKGKNKGG